MSAPKILVVEDSPETQQTLRGLFSELECEVAVVASGEEAMDRLEKELKPDIIILDFKLPGMSGADFYRGIAMDMRWKNLPVVPFTSQWNKQWGQDSKFAVQWIAATQIRKAVDKKGEESAVVSKGGQGENVSSVPEELVLAVGSALLRAGKTLPKLFGEAVDFLIDKKARLGKSKD